MSKKPLLALLLLPLLMVSCGGKPAPAGVAAPQATQAPAATPAGTPSATAQPQTLEVCKLVPLGDAEALARTPLDPGVEAPSHSPGCTYTGPVSGPVAQVEIYVGDGAKKFYDIDRELGHAFTPLTGIGDEAFAEENALFFRKAGTWVAIRLVLLNDPAENRDPLKALATKIAGRLG